MNPTALRIVFCLHWQRRNKTDSRKFLRGSILPALRRMKGQA
jgi:hypothetical protein